MNKEELRLFLTHLYFAGFIDINVETQEEFNTWFETQYQSKLTSKVRIKMQELIS